MKAKFLSPVELAKSLAAESRSLRRAMRRSVKGRGALAHATGTGFVDGPDTTEAVRRRMRNMPFYLAGVTPPLLDDPDYDRKLAEVLP